MNPLLGRGSSGGNQLLMGLMGTLKQTLKGQSPQMVLQFIAQQPGFEDWLRANGDKTINQLLNNR